jgi:hypothetical protein
MGFGFRIVNPHEGAVAAVAPLTSVVLRKFLLVVTIVFFRV